ncbi:MAG: 3-deoxy-D-manno-octulosonic acid transferase [Deltaproteobacteria bacterium]|nr:3-deoxy-D-manno-octulosonic acid transferase [Deltaproteobacteria bacterium]
MLYWIYNCVLVLFVVVSLPLLPIFPFLSKRFREGFFQRLGFYPRNIRKIVGGSRPVWIHAASVGEVLAARVLAGSIKERFRERKIIVSTFTSTGLDMARRTIETADACIFLPLDFFWVVRRALRFFDPCLLLFVETEIWPNLLQVAHRRGVPTLLLSGRLSAKAFRHYRFFRVFFSRVLRHFTAIGMQSREDAERLMRLGAAPEKISLTGNLKYALAGASDSGAKSTLERSIADHGKKRRPVVVVGSSHRGEEEVLLDVLELLKTPFPELLMVLAPRHPQRFSEVERLVKKRKFRYEKKSQMNGRVAGQTDVILLDTMGDLSLFYSMADVAFVGGSLVDAGGHNLVEPARFRKPVLFGPYVENCAAVAKAMKQRGGGIEVHGKEDLVREIRGLLSDREKAERMGEMAHGVVEGDRPAVQRTMDLVSLYLQP